MPRSALTLPPVDTDRVIHSVPAVTGNEANTIATMASAKSLMGVSMTLPRSRHYFSWKPSLGKFYRRILNRHSPFNSVAAAFLRRSQSLENLFSRLSVLQGDPLFGASYRVFAIVAQPYRWGRVSLFLDGKPALQYQLTSAQCHYAAAFFFLRFRNEQLNGKVFYSLKEIQVIIEQWRKHYNTKRPHSALGYRPPAQETIVPMDQEPIMH
jgi:transposase InsO family protein